MAVMNSSFYSGYLHTRTKPILVNSAATPLSQDPTPNTTLPEPNPRQTRVVLPKKKPLKWSTGVAPGEYGGPPLTTKLRKYWGGEEEDPVTATDDFIWNKDFMGRMKRLLEEKPLVQSPSKEEPSGFLSLNRAMSLNSVEIDLSKELAKPPEPVLEQQVEAARRGRSASESTENGKPRWRLVPTRREQEKWDRATKAATGGSDVMLCNLNKPRGDPEVLAAEAKEQYFKLKQKLQLLTLGIGGVGLVSAYVSYSPEITARVELHAPLVLSHASWFMRESRCGPWILWHRCPLMDVAVPILSFGAGFLGSLVYMRMLGSSIDSMADGAKGLIRGAIGQPRLLVPVALVMIYNRWNGILAPDYGFMHLDLIPMLVGFFTYKVATFVQVVEESLTVVKKENKS